MHPFELDRSREKDQEFFHELEGTYNHIRCDIEIAKYHANASAKAKAGIASAKARQTKKQQNSTGVEQVLNTTSTDEQLNINHKPLTNNHIKIFEEFWSSYPHRNGKTGRKQSLAWWIKQPADTLMMVLKATKNYKYFKPCFKHYLSSNVSSKIMKVPSSEWNIAIFLQTASFKKASATKVWADSRKQY